MRFCYKIVFKTLNVVRDMFITVVWSTRLGHVAVFFFKVANLLTAGRLGDVLSDRQE